MYSRYAAKDPDPDLSLWSIPCKHADKKIYQCGALSKTDLLQIKTSFFENAGKNQQHLKLAATLQVHHPARHRERNTQVHKPHDFQIRYTVSRNCNAIR